LTWLIQRKGTTNGRTCPQRALHGRERAIGDLFEESALPLCFGVAVLHDQLPAQPPNCGGRDGCHCQKGGQQLPRRS